MKSLAVTTGLGLGCVVGRAVALTRTRTGAQSKARTGAGTSPDAAEKRLAETLETLRSNFREIGERIPAIVNAHVAPLAEEMESRLKAEDRESWRQSMADFEQALDRKVADRMGRLEEVLAGHAGAIGNLRERAADADANLQRLIEAVEQLCERGLPGAPPAAENSARAAQPAAASPAAQDPSSPRLLKPAEGESRRPRVPMARIL
jgi:hypothetical protein